MNNNQLVRLELVDEVFDKVDELFVNLLNEKDLNFEEIDLVLYRLKEKVFQQKLRAYTAYMASEEVPNVEFPDKKNQMYR